MFKNMFPDNQPGGIQQADNYRLFTINPGFEKTLNS